MDQDDSLTSDFKVAALLRRASNVGVGAVVVRRGDADAGAILVKIAFMDGTACCLGPARAADGSRIYHPVGPVAGWRFAGEGAVAAGDAPPETAIDAMIARRQQSDPDLWVIEIEDRQGRHFLLEPVMLGDG